MPVGHGEHRHDEDQDAHPADPVREAAPEQHSLPQRLHGGQDAGPGRGEAGHCLKNGVHIVRDIAGQDKRKCPEQGH